MIRQEFRKLRFQMIDNTYGHVLDMNRQEYADMWQKIRALKLPDGCRDIAERIEKDVSTILHAYVAQMDRQARLYPEDLR